MKQSDYIKPEEYLDSPIIYGRHAPYWNSLSFIEKVDTIRHVGLFSFLRELLGFADAERTRQRLELRYSEQDTLHEQIATLEQEKQALQRQLAETTEKLKEAERVSHGKSHKLLTPPSTYDIMGAFNRSSAGSTHQWFFNPYEDPHTGVVTLTHNFMFYPFPSIIIPRGKLRLCDQYGTVANLAQNADYEALPAKYAQHLVPEEFHAYRMRVLFVTQDRDFWLADPRSAQDVILEIWTNYPRSTQDVVLETWTDDGGWRPRSAIHEDNVIKAWKEQYSKNNAMVGGSFGRRVFIMVVSIEKFLCGGQNNFSKEQIEKIRDKCYAEYLDIYFHDHYDEDA